MTIERSPATGMTTVTGVRMSDGSPVPTPSSSRLSRTKMPGRSRPIGAATAALAVKALALHPLVPSVTTAREIFAGYRARLPELEERFAWV